MLLAGFFIAFWGGFNLDNKGVIVGACFLAVSITLAFGAFGLLISLEWPQTYGWWL
jgi:hypothetical protein